MLSSQTAVLYRPDRVEPRCVWAILVPSLPTDIVPFVCDVLHALTLASTQAAKTPQFVNQQRIFSRELVPIDLEHGHAPEQKRPVIIPGLGWRRPGWRTVGRIDNLSPPLGGLQAIAVMRRQCCSDAVMAPLQNRRR